MKTTIKEAITDIEKATRLVHSALNRVIVHIPNPEIRRILEWTAYQNNFGGLSLKQLLIDIAKYGPDVEKWPHFSPLMPLTGKANLFQPRERASS